MTRKDYVIIADALAKAVARNWSDKLMPAIVVDVMCELCLAFKNDNNMFDSAKFRQEFSSLHRKYVDK